MPFEKVDGTVKEFTQVDSLTTYDYNLAYTPNGTAAYRLAVQASYQDQTPGNETFIDGTLASGVMTITNYALAHYLFASATTQALDFDMLYVKTAVPSDTIDATTITPGDTVIVTAATVHTFTAVAATPGANEFVTADDLAALIGAVSGLDASNTAGTITITVTLAGTTPNSWTITGTGNFATLNITFSGGQNNAILTVAGHALVQGTDWTAAGSGEATAQSIADAINLLTEVTAATGGSDTVTITAAVAGAAGNSITLTTTSVGGLPVSGSHLSGGQDGATVTIAGHALVESVDWDALVSDNNTATSLAAAIDALSETQSSASLSNVNIYTSTIGLAGNGITTTKIGNGVTTNQAHLTGGLDSDINGVDYTIRIPTHGMTTGLKVHYTLDFGANPTGLSSGTDYYAINVDTDHIQLATTLNNANNGIPIHIADADDSVGGSQFSLLATAMSTVIKLQASNDGEHFSDVSGKSVTVSTDGNIVWDLGTPFFKILRTVITPATGEIAVTLTFNAINLS